MIERASLTHNEKQRALWAEAQWGIPLRSRFYLDEAYRVGRAATRRFAWLLRGTRAESYAEASHGVRTSVFVAMAPGQVLNWMVTRPPPGQTTVDFLVSVTNVFLPRMRSVEEVQGWEELLDRCALVIDTSLMHDEDSLEVLRDSGVFSLSLPP